MLHHALRKDLLSWLTLAMNLLAKILLVVVLVLFVALATSQIIIFMTPELGVHPYESLPHH